MKYAILFLVIVLNFGCSNFQDNHEFESKLNLNFPLDEIDTGLPIINIVVDEGEFLNIYEKFTEDIEIEKASFNLYRNNQLLIEDEKIELELKGNYSRAFPLKSLGVKFEDKYDNRNRFLINPKKVLPHHSIDKIKSIRLRNSGNDFGKTMFKDLSYTELAIEAELDLDLAYGEPSLVFINEEFYGLLNIRTEVNANGISALHGVKKSKITLGKMETQNLIRKNGKSKKIDSLVQAVRDKDLAYIKEEVDLKNFIDYMIFESYIANEDWPHTNVRFFAIGDGKFRFIMHDLDTANEFLINDSPINFIDKRAVNFVSDLFLALYEDEEFNQLFWAKYKTLLDSGLVSADKFKTIVDANFDRIELEMPHQIEKYQSPKTVIEWMVEVDKISGMFEKREQIVKKLVARNF